MNIKFANDAGAEWFKSFMEDSDDDEPVIFKADGFKRPNDQDKIQNDPVANRQDSSEFGENEF